MEGNAICKQIDWDANAELLAAWREGRTGYPWIDAIMNQVGGLGDLREGRSVQRRSGGGDIRSVCACVCLRLWVFVGVRLDSAHSAPFLPPLLNTTHVPKHPQSINIT